MIMRKELLIEQKEGEEFITVNGIKYFPEQQINKPVIGNWNKVYFEGSNEFWGLMFVVSVEGKDVKGYGLNEGRWFFDTTYGIHNVFKEANNKEVALLLYKEAEKKGFKKGVWFKLPSSKSVSVCGEKITLNERNTEILYFGDHSILKDGVWGEVLETLTLKQAEEKLNCKIID